jgi:hypothetical protein
MHASHISTSLVPQGSYNRMAVMNHMAVMNRITVIGDTSVVNRVTVREFT